MNDHPKPTHPRGSAPTEYDRWRQEAYLRTVALRAAVQLAAPDLHAPSEVVTTAETFHAFLVRGHE